MRAMNIKQIVNNIQAIVFRLEKYLQARIIKVHLHEYLLTMIFLKCHKLLKKETNSLILLRR